MRGNNANGGNDNWAKTGLWALQARVVAECAAPPCVSVRDEEDNEQSPAVFVKTSGGDQKIATLHGAAAEEARAHRCARVAARCTLRAARPHPNTAGVSRTEERTMARHRGEPPPTSPIVHIL